MRTLLCVLVLSGLVLRANGQSISSINFRYLYDPGAEVSMQIQPVMHTDSVEVHFFLKSAMADKNLFVLEWQKRDSYNQRQGLVFRSNATIRMKGQTAAGRVRFIRSDKPWLLVAEVRHLVTGKRWVFARQIEQHYPVNGYLTTREGERIWEDYVRAERTYTVKGSGTGRPIHFSYYQENFPTPSPPFVSKEVKMERFLFPDSVFTLSPDAAIGPFKKEGLYLAQEDTTAAEGFSFLVKKEPYPKMNKLSELKGPLLFVTTQEENNAIGEAGEDKVKFDKVILDITNDKERARVFMRNYFKRVELANQYFTSFKEGWKTDRGMVYIVFGLADEITTNGQTETWAYKSLGIRFFFNKAGTVYHPDHHVLVRDKQYSEYWYQTIDLWRKSRF